ncbi:putative GIY-YIG superfamily endonuclease [Pedobacter sp. UYEF25]
MERGGCIYFMSNKHRTTIYIGVTADLARRILEHINHDDPKSFTARYNLNVCVYYESFFSIEEAIK